MNNTGVLLWILSHKDGIYFFPSKMRTAGGYRGGKWSMAASFIPANFDTINKLFYIFLHEYEYEE